MIKTQSSRKNKISQLFVMRTAIAKSRYKNPVGFFRGAQAINLSAHSFPGQDSGFPVPSDSVESPERTRTKRTWSDCPSVRRTCRNTSFKEFPRRAPRRVLPTCWRSILGGDGNDARQPTDRQRMAHEATL